MRRDFRGALVLAIFLGAILVGCGGSSATETPTPPASLSLAEQGNRLRPRMAWSAGNGCVHSGVTPRL